MTEFNDLLMRADKIVKRLGNIANRPDIRLAQNLQVAEILMLHWEHMDLNEDEMWQFGRELKKHLLSMKEREMNARRSSYSNEYLLGIESNLEVLERYLVLNDPSSEEESESSETASASEDGE